MITYVATRTSGTASTTARHGCCGSRSTTTCSARSAPATLAVDDRLPSEFDLADQYGVSRDVIRRAKEELVSGGWLIVLQGRGTFVAHPEPGSNG